MTQPNEFNPQEAPSEADCSTASTSEKPTATTTQASASHAPPRTESWLNRLVGRSRLRPALERVNAVPQDVRLHCLRTRHALELADTLANPIDPAATGPSFDLALTLYQQACFWALRANGIAGETLPDAIRASDTTLSLMAPEHEERTRLVEAALSDFVTIASWTQDRQRTAAQQLATLARALLARVEAPDRAYRQLRATVLGTRIVGLVLLLSLFIVGTLAVVHFTHGRDLASGKSWSTSSTDTAFDPRSGANSKSKVFFHTREQDQPWIRYDLQSPSLIKEVRVVNRTDCCSGRAVPLVVEVSDDGIEWQPVARREYDFRTWTASFAPTTKRYVRLRADKRTMLHLERVEVR